MTRVRRRSWRKGWKRRWLPQKQARRRQRLLDGEAEAHLVALACGKPPQGQAKWTIKLLAQRLVEYQIVDVTSGWRPDAADAEKSALKFLVEGLFVYPAEG